VEDRCRAVNRPITTIRTGKHVEFRTHFAGDRGRFIVATEATDSDGIDGSGGALDEAQWGRIEARLAVAVRMTTCYRPTCAVPTPPMVD